MESRHLHLRLAGAGTPEIRSYLGREHLVVPVVALMEGVIHAVNASEPEFVPAARLAAAASSWNGRPLVVNHPVSGGVQISANDPSVLAKQAFGTIFSSQMNGKRLGMQAWIDPQRLEALGEHAMLADIRAGKPIEVSVGAVVRTMSKRGEYNGKLYTAEWGDITGDHLAFLPRSRGACSLEMGCGAHRAAGEAPTVYEFEGDEIRELGGKNLDLSAKGASMKSARERVIEFGKSLIRSAYEGDEAAKATLKGASTLFDTPEEAASEEAAELIGYHALRTHLDALGKSWDEASDLVNELIADETENSTTTPAQEAAEEEVETARLESLMSLISGMANSASLAMSMCMNLNAPEPASPMDPRYMEGSEEHRALIGKVISAKNMKTIQAAHDSAHAMHDHTTALGAACNGMKLLAAKPKMKDCPACGSSGNAKGNPCEACDGTGQIKAAEANDDNHGGASAEGDENMNRQATIKALTECPCSGFKASDVKFLESATDAQLEQFKAAADARAEEQTKIRTLETAATEAPTEDEWMKKAPASVRSLVERVKADEAAQHEALVGTLKALQTVYTEVELKAKELPELRKLALLAGAEEPEASYIGRGVPVNRSAASNDADVYRNPPDGYRMALDKQNGVKSGADKQ